MRVRSRRLFIASAVLAAVALLAGVTAVGAAESRILSVSRPFGDPGIIDLTVSAVSFDAASRDITVTASVSCVAGVDAFNIEFTAVQDRGAARVAGNGFLIESPVCGETYSITSSEGSFKPGRVTIEVTSFACGLSCTSETVRVEAVLVPDNRPT